MKQKKYELTKETMCFDGVTLHRIQALKDFGNIDAGELGDDGFISAEYRCGGIIYLKPHGTACFWTYRSTGI